MRDGLVCSAAGSGEATATGVSQRVVGEDARVPGIVVGGYPLMPPLISFQQSLFGGSGRGAHIVLFLFCLPLVLGMSLHISGRTQLAVWSWWGTGWHPVALGQEYDGDWPSSCGAAVSQLGSSDGKLNFLLIWVAAVFWPSLPSWHRLGWVGTLPASCCQAANQFPVGVWCTRGNTAFPPTCGQCLPLGTAEGTFVSPSGSL